MKHKLQPGDKVTLKGNPLDEQLGQSLDTTREYAITQTSTTIPCGSGQAVKINGHNDWIDSAWFNLIKKHWQAYKDNNSPPTP
jgi:hypothetical protein